MNTRLSNANQSSRAERGCPSRGGHLAADTGGSHRWPYPSGRAAAGTAALRGGFTLVEMLLVLVILATLAAIVYPKVMGRSKQAQVTATQTQIGNFKIALDSFEVDNGYFPKGRNGLADLVQQPRDATAWHGPYLDSIPKDPWGNDYIYECPGKHNPSSYDIYSQGPPGDQAPIGNWQAQKR